MIYSCCYVVLMIMKMKIDVFKIDNIELERYILSNRLHSSQFDELEKREPLVEALVSDEDIESVKEMFDRILKRMKSNAT